MNKLKSVKVWVVIWALALITYIVITGKAEFLQLATLLSTIPLAYIPVNTWQKKILKGEEHND